MECISEALQVRQEGIHNIWITVCCLCGDGIGSTYKCVKIYNGFEHGDHLKKGKNKNKVSISLLLLLQSNPKD